MTRNADLLKSAGKIEGMLTDKEMLLLYGLAKNGPGKGVILEIGSYKGKSTACLALGTKEAKREKVFAVDWHEGWKNVVKGGTFGEFSENMKKCGVEDYVRPVVMKSEDAAVMWRKRNVPIRLLWIDGSHDYKDVRKDFVVWNRFLVEGGIAAFHDSFWGGPYRVVNEYLLKSGKFSCAGMVDYITFAVKSPPDAEEKKRNRRMLLLRSLLKYPMRAEHLHPVFMNMFVKNRFLSDFKSKKF